MRMYFSMLTKVPARAQHALVEHQQVFSSRMMSAASFAMFTAVSTEMPMSARAAAAASLMRRP